MLAQRTHRGCHGSADDLRAAIGNTFGIADPEDLERRRAELVAGPIRSWAANTEQQIIGPYAAGAQISVADLKLFVVIGWLKKGALDHVPSDVLAPFRKLETLFRTVQAHPKVAEWSARSR